MRVRARAHPYQLVHTWALGVSEPFEMLFGAAPVEMYPNKCPVETIEKCRRFGGLLHSVRQLILERIVSEEKALFS